MIFIHRNCLIVWNQSQYNYKVITTHWKFCGKLSIPYIPWILLKSNGCLWIDKLKRLKRFLICTCTELTLASCACSYLSSSISHFNLAYVELCKFTLLDESLQHGFVTCFLQLLKKDVRQSPRTFCYWLLNLYLNHHINRRKIVT